MKRITGIFFLLCISYELATAQTPYFQHYTLLKKNESVQVNAIYQSSTGFMWFGTSKGLFKFDGSTLERFTKANGISDDNVTAIAEDSLQRIWLGHKNGNISILSNDSVTLFNPGEGNSTHQVSDILFDRKGNLWFSTLNDGLYYFTKERLFRLDEEEGMPDLFIYDITEDHHGNILAGTDGGLVICSLHGKKVKIDVVNYERGLPDNIVKGIIVDTEDKIWLATEDAGVVTYDAVTKKIETLVEGSWNYGDITDFTLDENQVWISSKQTGLIAIDRIDQRVKIYDAKSGADFTSVNTIERDIEGNIWLGTKSGIERTLGNQVEFIEKFHTAQEANVVALSIDKLGDIWFANKEGLYRRVNAARSSAILKPLELTPYKKYAVISLYTDSAGFIWAGLYGEGVMRINPETNRIDYFNKELRNGNVLNITGKGNTIWLATLGGATQIKILGNKFAIKNYSTKDGLRSDYIYQVFIDHENNIWFATDGKGVNMLDSNGFHYYSTGSNTGVVYGITEDKNDHIWANVQGEGLYELENDKFRHFDKALFRNNNINAFTTDESGNLIVMHDGGVDVYDAKKNEMTYLGDNVGMRDKTANLNAVTTDNSGTIFIGTDYGIVIYNPAKNSDEKSPKTSIESLRVLDKNISLTSDLSFGYSENQITINYRGFWYQDPERVSYQYLLENYDRKWINSLDRSVIYSSLPPGEYTFKVRASDNGKFDETKKEASFSFIIRPPFWRTAWFYSLSIVTIITIASSFIKARERKLRRDKKELEAKVYERTLEIQKNNEEIQAQNEEIQSQAEEIQGINENLEELVKQRTAELERKNKALEEYAFINAHELRAPVASILGLIDLISKTQLDEESKVIVTHMEESAEKLNNIVRSITKAIERGG